MSNSKLFNKEEDFWRDSLRYPDWYERLGNFITQKIMPSSDDSAVNEEKCRFYEIVEKMLLAEQIPLANDGPNYDKERKPIDTVVIHHTSENPQIRLSMLSAIGFVRQYGKDYFKGNTLGNSVKGLPIWSNHFNNGKMIFYAYHYLIRPNGKIEKLLEEDEIGWQAGNWDINTRSVAIALSGDYSRKNPSKKQLESVKNLIAANYSNVDMKRIFGHREINQKTICPGNTFLGPLGWEQLIK